MRIELGLADVRGPAAHRRGCGRREAGRTGRKELHVGWRSAKVPGLGDLLLITPSLSVPTAQRGRDRWSGQAARGLERAPRLTGDSVPLAERATLRGG